MQRRVLFFSPTSSFIPESPPPIPLPIDIPPKTLYRHNSAKGASSPRKGPCPPPDSPKFSEPSCSLAHADIQAATERSFVCLKSSYPPAPTSSNTKNKPRTSCTPIAQP